MLSASLKEKMLLLLPQTLSALAGFLPAIAAALFDSLGLARLIESQPPVPFAKAALWLLALSLWLLSYILAKRPKHLYKFYPELGIKANLQKGLFICPKCNHPMRIDSKSFTCVSCEITVETPSKDVAESISRLFKENVYL